MNATTNVPHLSDFSNFSRFCHERAVAKGFWDETHPHSHYFVLADGELSENPNATPYAIYKSQEDYDEGDADDMASGLKQAICIVDEIIEKEKERAIG